MTLTQTLIRASRDNRESLPPSQSGVPKSPQESLFSFAGASSTFLWSRLSDHIGRKPVLITVSRRFKPSFIIITQNHAVQGMTGLMISMTCFGLSKTFSGLVVRYLEDLFTMEPSLTTAPTRIQ